MNTYKNSTSLSAQSPSTMWVSILSLGTFIVFFQGFMVAPILPQLSELFKVTVQHVSFIEPAYLLSYGISTLMYAPLSEKYGRFPVITFSLCGFIMATALTGFVQNIDQLIFLRLLTGLLAGGVAPTTIGWIGDNFPYEKRGHALGIFFGFMAAGTAFGSSAGALLTSFVGWRMLFWIVAGLGIIILGILVINRGNFSQKQNESTLRGKMMLSEYYNILKLSRARRTYIFVLLNSMFHSGIFAWTGYFFFSNYYLTERGVGLALLGYGIPGLLLGPFLGKMADKFGRNRIIPIGITVGAISTLLLAMQYPLLISCFLIATLSLAFDMTHPLFAAIITTLSERKGIAIGLFAFVMFMGYGLGSLIFSLIINIGINKSFQVFGFFAVLGAILSFFAFKNER
ncbi:MFS transporter [Epilithonimonas zeae]|uniref:Predicted arabinose efflux permease, MFS family n=1 Tax=Epilithonimonas zeae TaxID=1416779 RepID=A0A1N6G1G2_9FLAO|nr:MFS transporter [Epilithonimonas zeae]SIO01281.1 Predicted arabinose efflux permease, MFS family [Epilithonimonas zeae]